MAITKLDILSRVETIQVCVAYELDGQRIEDFPTDYTILDRCQPIYESLEGWGIDITQAQTFSDLPPQAKQYVTRLEELSGIPASCISVGPRREQTIQR